MAKKIKDLRNGRIYTVLEETGRTYTINKGAIVGEVEMNKREQDGKPRFKVIKTGVARRR